MIKIRNSKKFRNKSSRIPVLIFSIIFIFIFFGILAISIALCIYNKIILEQQEFQKIPFFEIISNFEILKDPFNILIELLTSIGGVFFGIRIGQWKDDKSDEENLHELWKKIHNYLFELKSGIDSDTNVLILSGYKIYWDSLQLADDKSARLLQEDKYYTDIFFVFSFLTFYNDKWYGYNNVNDWKNNAPENDREYIEKWINELNFLITYISENKISNKS